MRKIERTLRCSPSVGLERKLRPVGRVQSCWLHQAVVKQDGLAPRVAIIGSGPAGFYTAQKLMREIHGTKVDMYEQLPTPFGLVRFGVAPDHPEVKVSKLKFVGTHPDIV